MEDNQFAICFTYELLTRPHQPEQWVIDDSLIDDRLFVVTATPDWYARIVEFLTTQQLPAEWNKEERRKVRVDNRYFAVVGNRLFRRGADTIFKRCVSHVEVPNILEAWHDSICGGHYSGQPD